MLLLFALIVSKHITMFLNLEKNTHKLPFNSAGAIQGSARLTGGVYSNAVGNVEVFYNGVWGSVCSTGWNADAGRVVCAQLGYDTSSKYFSINPSTRYANDVLCMSVFE